MTAQPVPSTRLFAFQESVQDSVHEDSGSARIAAGQLPRPSFRQPHGPTRRRGLNAAGMLVVYARLCASW